MFFFARSELFGFRLKRELDELNCMVLWTLTACDPKTLYWLYESKTLNSFGLLRYCVAAADCCCCCGDDWSWLMLFFILRFLCFIFIRLAVNFSMNTVTQSHLGSVDSFTLNNVDVCNNFNSWF